MPHFPLCKTQKINNGSKGLHEHGNKKIFQRWHIDLLKCSA